VATLVVFPATGALGAGCDGYVQRIPTGGDEDWTTILAAGTGTAVNTASTGMAYQIAEGSQAVPDTFSILRRPYVAFDTSALGAGAVISAADLNLYSTSKVDFLAIAPSMNIYAANPVTWNTLVIADWIRVSSTKFANDISYASWNGTGLTTFNLNATGIAAIDPAGHVNFCLRSHYDATGVNPSVGGISGTNTTINIRSADTAGTATDPNLTITYTGSGPAAQTLTAPLVDASPATYAPVLEVVPVGRAVWTTPADAIAIAASPTLAFTMPTAVGPMHFELQVDDDPAFGSPVVDALSGADQTGWEYWTGSAWAAVPATGVPSSFAGNEARYTIQTPLAAGTWSRRVRAGTVV
jgi:hypothetical protein